MGRRLHEVPLNEFGERIGGSEPLADDAADKDSMVLVAALKRRDAGAFELLVRGFSPKLLAVARRLTGNHEDAQDCVQEAFLAVHRKIDDFEERAALGTWLHRIVVNAAISKIRARQRGTAESIEDLQPRYDRYGHTVGPSTITELSADQLLERAETSQAVRKAIDGLPPTYRAIVLLRDIEGYDTREVAELLGLNPGAVKTRLHRARTALKTLLEPLFRRDGA